MKRNFGVIAGLACAIGLGLVATPAYAVANVEPSTDAIVVVFDSAVDNGSSEDPAQAIAHDALGDDAESATKSNASELIGRTAKAGDSESEAPAAATEGTSVASDAEEPDAGVHATGGSADRGSADTFAGAKASVLEDEDSVSQLGNGANEGDVLADGSEPEGESDPAASDSGQVDKSQASQAREPLLADGAYLIESANGNRQVLDVASGSKSDGANVQSYQSNMTGAQKWIIKTGEDGYTTITNEGSGKLLDVQSGVAKSGTNVWQYGANGTAAQRWLLVQDGSWWKVVSALDPSLVLDLAGAGTANGTNLQVYTDNGTRAQRFLFLSLNPVAVAASEELPEDGYYALVSSVAGSPVLDVASAGTSNGTNAQIYGANGTFAQTWSFVRSGEYYQFKSACSDKVLDVDSGSIVPGANVQTWAADSGSANQLFSAKLNDDGTYTFTNVASGLVLDVSNGYSTNGANVQAYTANGTAAQRWTLRKVLDLLTEGLYEVVPRVSSGQRVDVASASTASGANVQTYSSNGTLAQKWRVERVGQNRYALRSVASGRILSAASDGNAVQAPTTADDSSTWEVASVSAGYVALRNVATGKVLDVSGAGTASGTNVQSYDANGTSAQMFRFASTNPMPEGTYVIKLASNGGLALDVASGSKDSGANVQVYQFNDTGAQKWVLKSLGGGVYRITNAQSGLALDVTSANGSAGANVQQWTSNGTAAQQWRVVYTGGAGTFELVSGLAGGSVALDAGGWSGANAQLGTSTSAPSFTFTPTTYTPPVVKPAVTYPAAVATMIQRAGWYSSATNWLALVDTTNNYAGFFTRSGSGWSIYKWARVSSGAASTPTKIGQFEVGSRGYSFGSGYTCYYWTQFSGAYLFHSVLYRQGTFNVLDGRLGMNLSHGCVRMDINDAKWVYSTLPTRTRVVTYRA